MAKYAQNTSVAVETSRAEIERTLTRYGASKFMYGHDSVRGIAQIQFEAKDRHIRFVLHLPDRWSKEFTETPARGWPRSESESFKAWEQGCRQRWRALALCIKAKLEAVEAGISEFEDEFLAHIVLPGDQTVGQYIRPKLAMAYETGEMPKMLPGLPHEVSDAS